MASRAHALTLKASSISALDRRIRSSARLREDRAAERMSMKRATRLVSQVKEEGEQQQQQQSDREDIVKTYENSLVYITSQSYNLICKGVASLKEILMKSSEITTKVSREKDIVERLLSIAEWEPRESSDNNEKDVTLQVNALHCITSITSLDGEPTTNVVNCGAIKTVKILMTDDNPALANQALWVLGNICGDSPNLRDRVLINDVVITLGQLAYQHIKENDMTLNYVAWIMSNLCRGCPSPQKQYIYEILRVLIILVDSENVDVLLNTLWSISIIAQNVASEEKNIIDMLETPFYNRVLSLFYHTDKRVSIHSVIAIGSLSYMSNAISEKLVSLNIMGFLKNMLHSHNQNIIRDTCWTLSSLLTSEKAVVSATENGVLLSLIPLLNSEIRSIRKEAIWSLANAADSGGENTIKTYINAGILEPLCSFLEGAGLASSTKGNSERSIVIALELLDSLFAFGASRMSEDGINKVVEKSLEYGVYIILDNLQHDNNDVIYQKANIILRSYFEVESYDEEEDLAAFGCNEHIL